LGPADALELGVVLDAAALIEELAVGRQLEAVRAQVLREHERERVRDRRVRDADLLHAAKRQFERDLPVLEAGVEQFVQPEPERRDQLGVDACLLEPRPFEVGDDDVLPPVDLRVQERVAERERHLVPELRMANRVAVDQDVGHAADSNVSRTLVSPA
jgi:hypothetical protein